MDQIYIFLKEPTDLIDDDQNTSWKLSKYHLPSKNIILLVLKQKKQKMKCVNKTKTKYVLKITDRAALRIASKFGDLQELVIII